MHRTNSQPPAPEQPDSAFNYAKHGIVSRQALLADGMSRTQLELAQELGTHTRVSRSLFATTSAHSGLVAAIRAGGALSCLSALHLYGIWTVSVPSVHHIRRAERRRRDGKVPGAVECRSTLSHRRVPLDSLDAALMAVFLNHDDEDAIVAMDCVLHTRLRDRASLQMMLMSAPKRKQQLLGVATGLVESAVESLFRFRLWQVKVRVRPQVHIPGIGRVDFLIGTRLIVEIDGAAYHSGNREFRRDRKRDRRAAEMGYITLRFTAAEVLHAWPEVLGLITIRGVVGV